MSKKILIVDDDIGEMKLVFKLLEKNKLKSIVAFNGVEALERVQREQVDLIILDVEMPEMNGYTFMMELDKLQDIPCPPIIILTSYQDMEAIFHRRGIKEYMIKPFNAKVLLSKVRKYIK